MKNSRPGKRSAAAPPFDSAERVRLAIENHAIGIFETDPATETVYWNTELEQIFGYQPGEFDGKLSTWKAHVTPDDLLRVDAAFGEAFANKANGMHYAYNMRRRDGAIRHIEASVQFHYDPAGIQIRRVGVNVDVTDRLAEDARLSMMFDQMYEGFMACEIIYTRRGKPIDFRFLKANGPFNKGIGLDPAHTIGKRASEILPGMEKFWLDTFTRVVETGTPVTFTRYLKPLNQWFHVHVYRYAQSCFAALFLDITQQKHAEQEARKAQRDSLRMSRLTAMGAIASTLAHELNQPLSASVNYLTAIQTILGRNPQDELEKIKVAVERALAANLRAGKIIKHMRGFTLEGYIERKIEYLGEIIDAAADETLADRVGRNLLLNLHLHEKSSRVYGSKIQLEQVFSNLFRNAAEAMKARKEPREIVVSSKNDGECVEVSVSDTGPGLTTHQLKHLFEPFVNSSKQGLGLGLSICRTIIEAHGGNIRANSVPGQGAAFIIRLPRPPNDLS